jgi:ketosteroid isomerase-like protein
LSLFSSRWSDDTGNVTDHLHVFEIDDDGLICYEGRFDAANFEGAYRALTQRYCAGEGAAYALSDTTLADVEISTSRGDFDRMFSELVSPELRVENRSGSAFPNRSAEELRAAWEQLDAMVASVREWHSAECWLDSDCGVLRHEREAVGKDGEKYTWTRLAVTEFRDGRVSSMCEFEPEDEDAAFAYAEERVRSARSRLAVTNGASKTADALFTALAAHDVDGAVAHVSAELRAAVEQILRQYNCFEYRTLAVRGERLSLFGSQWSDDAGHQAAHLHVFEIDDDGLICYEGRFVEDDFDGAYRELNRRYQAGEGAPFAEGTSVTTEVIVALNQGDLDRLFDELFTPEVRVENRSRSAIPNRSAREMRAGLRDLDELVASSRTWISAMLWLTPDWNVTRWDREAVGPDGEQYAWTRLCVMEVSHGRLASMCEFEIEDDETAFAYAEERVRRTEHR